MKRSLTPEMRAFLEAPRYAVVGTSNRDGSPHLTVMWYLFEGEEIVLNTRQGRVKDRNWRRDPRASFLVADGLQFLRVDGTVRTIEDPVEAQADIRRMAIRYDGEESGERQARDHFSTQVRISYRLPVREVYAHGF